MTTIKNILLHLTMEEYSRLKVQKKELKLTWEKFLLFLSEEIEQIKNKKR